MTRLPMLCLVLSASLATAADPTAEARRAQLEALRGEIAGQLQLQAFDLLDELVYGWNQQPPFAAETPLVLADVSVPVGFGSGLQALIENHLVELLTKNPNSHLVLTHCPQCTSIVVHSGKSGTIVARGFDEPQALSQAGAGSGSHHALFLDFEAEGAALVLRARITALEQALPIVYAKTLSTSTSSPALLRSPEKLKSAEEARKEYLDALTGRGPITVPIRLGLRSYAQSPSQSVAPMPFFWLNVGVEVTFNQARAWLAEVNLGATWAPGSHAGWSAQARISRLLTGSVSSLTWPDVYGYVGVGFLSIYGQGSLIFREQIPTVEELLADSKNDPHSLFGIITFGVEVRVKNRIGLGLFIESAPTLNLANGIGRYLDLGILAFHTLGGEVTFCF
jgi:hypothetical protein